jgi:hypothetical protein
MKKSDLLKFINRYHLSGATTSVKWTAKDGVVATDFITDDQNVIGKVTVNLDMGNHELGVFATPQLVKMLSATNEDLEVNVKDIGGKAVSMAISDGDVDMTFMLADLTVIRQVPELKNTPDFLISIAIGDEFISKFVKAKNAIPDADNFGVSHSAGVTDIVLNYASINTNRIKYSIPDNVSSDMGVVCFSANLFKDILLTNKDAETATLEVSSAGLARVTFKSQSYASVYYLVQLQTS